MIGRISFRTQTNLCLAILVALALLGAPSVACAADDYPFPGQSGVDPWGFYKGYCTSFVAWRMNRNAGDGSFSNCMDGGRWGDAGNWGANARALGYPVNGTPAVGAIAWWAAGTISRAGHVAYVEAVNTDGTIVVEDYNYVALRYDRRTIPITGIKAPSGYIHFHDVPADASVPTITLSCVKNGGVYASAITPTFSVTDNALKWVTATLNGLPFTSGTPVSTPGRYTLTVTASDMSGNKAVVSTAFMIDPASTDPDVAFTTIAGADRYETAVKMSQATFDRVSCVIIATGQSWPDALGGAALAGVRGAPILLTRSESLPPVVLAEITRLGATSAVILGGTKAVGPAVEATLRGALGDVAVSRIGGDSRYDTAALIASEVVAAQGDAYDGTCLVATGVNFPDALAASPLSTAKRWPLVLVGPDGLSDSTAAVLGEIGATDALILGGIAAVSESTEASLTAELEKSAVIRLDGVDRYSTAAQIAVFTAAHGLCWDGAALATGQNFPDALAGGAMQGKRGSVMLLTRGTELSPAARSPLVMHKVDIRALRYLGGEGALSAGVKNALSQALE